MKNIAFCIAGRTGIPETFAPFNAKDIAPHLLPVLHQLLTASPTEEIYKFALSTVSTPSVALALARTHQCPKLAEYLVLRDERVSRMAISALDQMTRMDAGVIQLAYHAMASAIGNIPALLPGGDTPHPAVRFMEEISPHIIDDCFKNSLWSTIAPLVTHKIPSIRSIALQKVIEETRKNERTRVGLVEIHILGFLDQYYSVPTPSAEIVDFIETMLSLRCISFRVDCVRWLIARLSDPSKAINLAAISAIRLGLQLRTPDVQNAFLQADILRRIAVPPTQSSPEVTQLLCEMLPELAVTHARANYLVFVTGFLDNGDATVTEACVLACKQVVNSTPENRLALHNLLVHLPLNRESTLMVWEFALGRLCADWIESQEYPKIVELLTHAEPRMRTTPHFIWLDLVVKNQSAREAIACEGLLGVTFTLMSSPYSEYPDCVTLAAQTLPHLAVVMVTIGNHLPQILDLLRDSSFELRQAAMRAIQVVAESSTQNLYALVEGGALSAVLSSFLTNPQDIPEVAHRVLLRFANEIAASQEACSNLLQLLK